MNRREKCQVRCWHVSAGVTASRSGRRWRCTVMTVTTKSRIGDPLLDLSSSLHNSGQPLERALLPGSSRSSSTGVDLSRPVSRSRLAHCARAVPASTLSSCASESRLSLAPGTSSPPSPPRCCAGAEAPRTSPTSLRTTAALASSTRGPSMPRRSRLMPQALIQDDVDAAADDLSLSGA